MNNQSKQTDSSQPTKDANIKSDQIPDTHVSERFKDAIDRASETGEATDDQQSTAPDNTSAVTKKTDDSSNY